MWRSCWRTGVSGDLAGLQQLKGPFQAEHFGHFTLQGLTLGAAGRGRLGALPRATGPFSPPSLPPCSTRGSPVPSSPPFPSQHFVLSASSPSLSPAPERTLLRRSIPVVHAFLPAPRAAHACVGRCPGRSAPCGGQGGPGPPRSVAAVPAGGQQSPRHGVTSGSGLEDGDSDPREGRDARVRCWAAGLGGRGKETGCPPVSETSRGCPPVTSGVMLRRDLLADPCRSWPGVWVVGTSTGTDCLHPGHSAGTDSDWQGQEANRRLG